METSRDWHESDRFWELAEPIMFDDNRWLMAPMEVESVMRLVRAEPRAKVLDMCCGPGRHSLELARRGYTVTGVDRTERFIEKARRKAGDMPLELVLDDARTFVRPAFFDIAINLYTSFGYFANAEEDEIVARNLSSSLKPGGSLVIQTIGKEVAAGQFLAREWEEKGDLILLDERRIVGPFEAIENKWITLRNGERQELSFVVRLYAASEMSALLKRAGFAEVRFFGTLDGLPYDQNARRMVAVARKAG